jgi:hypothetical protein
LNGNLSVIGWIVNLESGLGVIRELFPGSRLAAL